MPGSITTLRNFESSSQLAHLFKLFYISHFLISFTSLSLAFYLPSHCISTITSRSDVIRPDSQRRPDLCGFNYVPLLVVKVSGRTAR